MRKGSLWKWMRKAFSSTNAHIVTMIGIQKTFSNRGPINIIVVIVFDAIIIFIILRIKVSINYVREATGRPSKISDLACAPELL